MGRLVPPRHRVWCRRWFVVCFPSACPPDRVSVSPPRLLLVKLKVVGGGALTSPRHIPARFLTLMFIGAPQDRAKMSFELPSGRPGMRPGMGRSASFGRIAIDPHSPISPRSSFGISRASSFDIRAKGHASHVSSKTYSEFTLPHPLLRSRSPFALPPRDYTPSTERAAQVYSARAVTYDADGSRTGPQFAVHHKGWGRPCSTGAGESGMSKVAPCALWACHSSAALPFGLTRLALGGALYSRGIATTHRPMGGPRRGAPTLARVRIPRHSMARRREADTAIAAAQALV